MTPEALHIFFLPLLAPGHMLPMVDMAKLFAQRGVKATIITTPINASYIQPSIDLANNSNHPIQLLQIQFASSVAGLPQGCENLTSCRTPDVTVHFFKALNLFKQPFEQLLREHSPDCIIADTYYPWTSDVAREFGIPRLIFHGTGSFSIYAMGCLKRLKPHENVSSDTEAFVLPQLPHRVEMTRSQLPDFALHPDEVMNELGASHLKSHGIVVNSFCELELDYATKVAGLKTWHIGPVSLCNRDAADRAVRGDKASADYGNCLNWLDSKKPNSVLYVCFGSLCRFTNAQLREIALGLEGSNHPFIWVVGKGGDTSEWMPEGFEERIIEGKGRIIRGWAPQILVLNNQAIGGFVTHCGWNSSLEGISAGVPMITWPLFAEQFFNERFIVDVLRTGIGIGIKKCSTREEERELVKGEHIEKAVRRLMGVGEEAESMRKRAMEFGAMSKRAVEEGGSSYNSLSNLIEDLLEVKAKKLDV